MTDSKNVSVDYGQIGNPDGSKRCLHMREKPTISPIVIANKWWEWIISFGIYAGVFLLMIEYHSWRAKPYSLFTTNKSLAIASALCICFALSLGPLYRLTGKFRKAIRLRRPLGLVAVLLVIVHVTISLLLLPQKFDLSYYAENWPSLASGAAALLGFLVLAAISFSRVLERLGLAKWKAIQSYGYVLLVLVLAHFVVLGTPANWLEWFITFNQPVPPGTLVPFVFGTAVILLKATELMILRRKRSSSTPK